MTSASSGDCFFVDATDLSDEQIAITQHTYLKHASNYVENYERKPGLLEQIRPYTLDPFFDYYKAYGLTKPILFVGCASGRDIQETEKRGIAAIGIDLSPAMINIGKNKGVKSDLQVMDLENLTFPDGHFSGIFCETAITHTKKSNLANNLLGFARILEPGGIILIGLRESDGRVYYTEDKVGGKRYNTTFTNDEVEKMLTRLPLEIIKIVRAENPIPHRPSFFDCFLRKPL